MVMAATTMSNTTGSSFHRDGQTVRGRAGVREGLKAFNETCTSGRTLHWADAFDSEDGTGVIVALLDSGLNWSDANFNGAHIRGRDFTGLGSLFDSTGHGTKNAALLVGRRRDGAYSLVPECSLLVAKVLGGRGRSCTVRAIVSALRWALQSGAHIIAMPFGTTSGEPEVAKAVRAAAASGARLFAAAGNRGAEALCFPARLPQVTAVSGLAWDGSVYPGCCSHSDIDIYAWADGVPAFGADLGKTVSGSSAATVLAAGVAAIELAIRLKQSD